MKLIHKLVTFLFSVLFLITLVTAATPPQKSVIISFPKDTPGHILKQAKDAVIAAGGMITHEYSIIQAFACTGPAKAFDMIHELTSEYNPSIEDDQIVSISN